MPPAPLLTLAFLEAPFGRLSVAASERGVCAVSIDRDLDDLRAELQRRFAGFSLQPGGAAEAAAAGLRAFLAGAWHALDRIETDPGGTDFHRLVWAELRRIPVGGTLSYGELALRIGRPQAVRAVAQANARNPLAVLIPCHRVIGADGRLTGYAGGLAAKEWLLRFEAGAPGAGVVRAVHPRGPRRPPERRLPFDT